MLKVSSTHFGAKRVAHFSFVCGAVNVYECIPQGIGMRRREFVGLFGCVAKPRRRSTIRSKMENRCFLAV